MLSAVQGTQPVSNSLSLCNKLTRQGSERWGGKGGERGKERERPKRDLPGLPELKPESSPQTSTLGFLLNTGQGLSWPLWRYNTISHDQTAFENLM